MRRAGGGRAIIAGTAFVTLLACGDSGGDGIDVTSSPGSGPGTSTGETVDSTDMISGSTVELSRAEAWDLAEATDDPLVGERPEFVQCEIGWEVVTGGFEVDTGLCAYGAFVQPVLAGIVAGDELELRMTRAEPSQPPSGHLAIALGSEIVFETQLSAADEEEDVQARWVAPNDVTVGTPLHLHLHDAGPNLYRLATLTVTHRS